MGTSGGTSDQRYDVIVVGAGSAGAVVARRLLDRGDVRVLLLESGGRDTGIPAIHNPGRVHELWMSEVDWAYTTVPQPHAADRELFGPRGRVLGGSSSLNAMIWVRGNPADFDSWAYAGNPGWAWKDVLPTYLEIEDFDAGASEYHATGGVMHLTTQYEPDPIHAAIIAAAENVGIPHNLDYNGATQDGVSTVQLSVLDKERNSTARAYLGAVLDHRNLTLLTFATARRLLFEGTRCVGLEYEREGRTERAYADGEVVVAGGAIGSPGLLLSSGVGPADELRELGIGVVADLPGVGRNLHDHLLSPIIYGATREIGPPSEGLPACQTHLFWRTDPALPTPDLQPIHFSVPMYEPWMEASNPNGFTTVAGMVRPHSRGTVRLAGRDPSDGLLLDPASLEAQADIDMLVASLELCREYGQDPALRDEFGTTELYPGPGVTSRAELEDYARRTAITYHHQVGTCKMGHDVDAVVDHRLAVHGLQGLRVIDASIMPSVTTGNTNAPSILIGEKGAGFVADALSGAPARAAAPA
jgi:choline dehydrogenase